MFTAPISLVASDLAFIQVVYVIGLMTLILAVGLTVLFAATDSVLHRMRRPLHHH